MWQTPGVIQQNALRILSRAGFMTARKLSSAQVMEEEKVTQYQEDASAAEAGDALGNRS